MANYTLDLGRSSSVIPDQYDSIHQQEAQKKYRRSVITLMMAAAILFVGFLIMTIVNPHQLAGWAAPFGVMGMVGTFIGAVCKWDSIRETYIVDSNRL